jgi:ubiquinone/menaquinone biosynthesis C-methylase UbiE
LPDKLRRLGVLDLPRETKLLDACCGKGETLHILREEGFRQLWGVDGSFHRSWEGEPDVRFVAGDVRELPFVDESFDAVINLHSLHHLASAQGASALLNETYRVLRPGGSLYVIDFPGSPQINLLFWALRRRLGVVTAGLRNFAAILDDEWPYVGPYLSQWREVRAAISGGPFELERWQQDVFLYYLRLRRPEASH